MSYANPMYSSSIIDIPSQMISAKQKDQKWKESCMDGLESVGRMQYHDNLRLIENYEMVKGRFIYSHYFEADGYMDIMAQLTREFELPSYLRHYDIISQVINTLKGEYQKRPDIFRIRNYSEEATNQFERDRTDLLHKYVMSKIDAEVAKKLLEEGLDPERGDFMSEEEQQQYQQMIDQAKQQLTPPEIQEYMITKWSQQAELWGQHQLELDKERYNLQEKELREFEDMLVADRCFRHFYLTPTGYNQETWNPIQVFFHKSPNIENVEDGDYVGRVFQLSIPAIIDRYGHIMTKKELDALQDTVYKPDKRWNYAPGTEYVYQEYMMPFKGFPEFDIARKTAPSAPGGIPVLDSNFFDSLANGRTFSERKGLYFVTEGYWMSQMKIGKVVYIDPETGIKTRKYVDEHFIVPEDFEEMNSSFNDSDDINTVTWTWVNQPWKGVKINLKNTPYGGDLYIGVKPCDFQFKGDYNPYGAKLPVCGQIFSIRNSGSMSLVDLMKPYQIFYNVMLNQLYQIGEREIGRFLVWEVNMFPDGKDWGGEKAYEKFNLVAKHFGLVPADTSPNNMEQNIAGTAGYLPKDFNFDESARMMSRMQLAQQFEQMALRQVGFNAYRLGAYTSEATAQGVQEGREASYSQTESYFTNFSNYLKRCYEMDLGIAQYVQAKDKDATVFYSKSDMSRGFIKIAGTELLLADLHVRVVNSQEYIRQIESLRALAINNNTSGASLLDLAEVITTNSPEQIKIKLKESFDRQQSQIEREQGLKQQELKQTQEFQQAQIAQNEDHFTRELQNNLDVAYIKEGANIINTDTTPPPNQKEQPQDMGARQDQRLELDRQIHASDKDFKNKTLALKQAEMEKDLVIEDKKLNIIKILKDKK